MVPNVLQRIYIIHIHHIRTTAHDLIKFNHFSTCQRMPKNMKFYEFFHLMMEFHFDTFHAKIPLQIRNTLVNRNTAIENYYYSPHVPHPSPPLSRSAFHFREIKPNTINIHADYNLFISTDTSSNTMSFN